MPLPHCFPRKISYFYPPPAKKKKKEKIAFCFFSSSELMYCHEFSFCGRCLCVYIRVGERKMEFLPPRGDHAVKEDSQTCFQHTLAVLIFA